MSYSLRDQFRIKAITLTSVSGLALMLPYQAIAQTSDQSFFFGGLTFSYEQTETSTTEIAQDNTEQSPDRFISHFITSNQTRIDGPRTDVEDIFLVEHR